MKCFCFPKLGHFCLLLGLKICWIRGFSVVNSIYPHIIFKSTFSITHLIPLTVRFFKGEFQLDCSLFRVCQWTWAILPLRSLVPCESRSGWGGVATDGCSSLGHRFFSCFIAVFSAKFLRAKVEWHAWSACVENGETSLALKRNTLHIV